MALYTMKHTCAFKINIVSVCPRTFTKRRRSLEATMLKQDNRTVPEFTRSDAHINELLDLMHEIADLSALGSIAEWDQNTAMPAGATAVRGFQMATIKGVLHERWTSSRLGDLLGELRQKVQQSAYSDADRGLVR